MEGLVLRSTGSFYDVLGTDGKKYNCRTRGKIRLAGIKETNPIAVGDRVVFEITPNDPIGSITNILPRKNHILRQSVKKAAHSHVLAANVDQVLLVVTLAFPRTSLGFIDRFLVSAESFRIPQVIVFNKKDLLGEAELAYQQELTALYERLGVICFTTSALAGDQAELLGVLKEKITLIAGHSGVGKSTLLNQLIPGTDQKTGDVSGVTEKGTHTTTFGEMFSIDGSSYIIDTPGVKEFGLVDMNLQEISDYFPEMRELRLECKFGSRCIHINEPKCAVRDAVERGEIAVTRYTSYISMLTGDDNRR